MAPVVVCLLAGTLLGCTVKRKVPESTVPDFRWLTGTWEYTDSIYIYTETWNTRPVTMDQQELVYSMSGYATTIALVSGDTVVREVININVYRDFTAYGVQVNEVHKVAYRYAGINAGREHVFENMENPFPQRIFYRLRETDSLYARIDGLNKSGYRKAEFFYHRKK